PSASTTSGVRACDQIVDCSHGVGDRRTTWRRGGASKQLGYLSGPGSEVEVRRALSTKSWRSLRRYRTALPNFRYFGPFPLYLHPWSDFTLIRKSAAVSFSFKTSSGKAFM